MKSKKSTETREEREEREKWHEKDYIDALCTGYTRYQSDEEKLIRTTAMIPLTMRIEIERIGAHWNYSQRYIIFQLVYLGHAKFEHKYDAIINEIKRRKNAMGHPKIKRVKQFLFNMRTRVNGLEDPKQRAIVMDKRITASLATMAEALSVEYASLIRLSMYYSIITLEDVAPEVIAVATHEIQKFQTYIEETDVLYEGLILVEAKWAEREQELKAEVKEYPIKNCTIAEERKVYKKEGP